MADYTYPAQDTLTLAGQEKMAVLTQEDPIFDYFPIVEENTSVLSWEQEDADDGLQQIRGINGAPKKVEPLGAKRFTVEPGVFGEFRPVDEKELTERRALGSLETAINIDDLVAREQDRLLGREIDRIKMVLWLLATKGEYNLLSETDQLIYAAAYDIPTYTASVAWGTLATATPIANIRNAFLAGLDLITDADFGSNATLFINGKKAQQLFGNTNANDLGGRFQNIREDKGLEAINKIMVAEGLPKIRIHNGGYVLNGTKYRYIPDDAGMIFADRREPIGSYTKTRNAQNPGSAPGSYDFVFEEPEPPKQIRVHRGHNGGAKLIYGKSLMRLANI